jgi:hypothetical protein
VAEDWTLGPGDEVAVEGVLSVRRVPARLIDGATVPAYVEIRVEGRRVEQ